MKEKIIKNQNPLQQRLDQLIEMKGLNKSKLATMAGVRPQAVTKWYDRGEIGKSSALKIAAGTGVSVDWILEGGPELHEMNAHRVGRLEEWFGEKGFPEDESEFFTSLKNGGAAFTDKTARRIENTYGLPRYYLDSGYSTPTDDNLSSSLTEIDKELLYNFHRLTQESKQEFLNQIKEKADWFDKMYDELDKIKKLK